MLPSGTLRVAALSESGVYILGASNACAKYLYSASWHIKIKDGGTDSIVAGETNTGGASLGIQAWNGDLHWES